MDIYFSLHPKRILVIGVLLFFVFTASCLANLNTSVNKYRNSGLTGDQIRKLSQFDHLIRYYSNFAYFVPRHKVNPDFIRALIVAESGVNPNAVSKKNALGLGQIILSTGKQAGAELSQFEMDFKFASKSRLNNLKQSDLFDPAINILLTCYLISKYNHRFDGRLDLVVSAWNAGENTNSLSHGRHAPYEETENLIGKVNGYYTYLLKHKIFP